MSGFKHLVFLILFLALPGGLAQGAASCKSAFSTNANATKKTSVSFPAFSKVLSRDFFDEKKSFYKEPWADQKLSYNQAIKRYEEIKSKYSKEDREFLDTIIIGSRFFSYKKWSFEILKKFLKGKRIEKLFIELYPDARSFFNLIKTHNKIFTSTERASPNFLLSIYKELTSHLRKREDTNGFRGDSVGVGETFSNKYKTILEENQYLSTHTTNNRRIKLDYLDVANAKKKVLDSIKEENSDFVKEILAFQKGEVKLSEAQVKKMNKELLSLVLAERFRWFAKEKNEIGELKSEEKTREYINLVAQLHRDLISIHPFVDYNGRTISILTNVLLTRKGLFPTVIVDKDMDYLSKAKDWGQALYEGTLAYKNLLYSSIHYLENKTYLVENPYVIFPFLKTTIPVLQKTQGSKKVKESEESLFIHPEQWKIYLKTKLESSPELLKQIEKDPYEPLSELAEAFYKDYQKHNIIYHHKKKGTERLQMPLIVPEFAKTLEERVFHDAKLWKEKIENWYTPQMLWRGMANQSSKVSEEMILSYFTKFSDHAVSNNILYNLDSFSQKSVMKKGLEDFANYNKEWIEGTYYKTLKDHHQEGPRYDNSYGISFSRKKSLGQSYAMGFEVFGIDMKKIKTPQVQNRIKSRINIGVLASKKSIYLGRVKPIESRFSYKYGRQQEQLEIGVVEPDAIMVVQVLNPKGEVEKSYVRNPKKPHLIYLIEGEFVPDMKKSFENIPFIKAFDLRK